MAEHGSRWVEDEVQWEYSAVRTAAVGVSALVDALVEAGAKGWKVVNFAFVDPTVGINELAAVLERRVVPPPPPAAPEPAWHPDPTGRFAKRWWDGHQWTAHVATDQRTALDAPSLRARDE
jgi:hypothetical protein